MAAFLPVYSLTGFYSLVLHVICYRTTETMHCYMKKLMLAAGMAVCIMAHAQNQEKNPRNDGKGFYIKLTGGYFFSVSPGQFPNVGPYPPQEVYKTVDPATGASATVSQKVLTGSYGQGIRGGLSGGYNFSRYIGAELTVNYYHSKKNLMTHEKDQLSGSNTVVGQVTSHGYVNAIDLAPSIVMSPGLQGHFNPYLRFGVVVPVWGRLHIETDAYKVSAVSGQPAVVRAQTTIQRKEEIRPNATLGFQGALGVTYRLGQTLDLFIETEYRNVPVKGKDKEVTAYNEKTNVVNTASGQVIASSSRGLGDLSVAERQTEYQTTLDQHSNTPTGVTDPGHPTQTQYKDNNKPSNDLKSYINIGGLGINLGIRFRL
jgi:opacity protein-like surface antigen